MKLSFAATTAFFALFFLFPLSFAQNRGTNTADVSSQTAGFSCPNKETAKRPFTKIELGDVTKRALQLPRAKHPQLAKTSGTYGDVKALIVVDLNSGRTVWAQMISGHSQLQAAVKAVVCSARFANTYDVDGFASGILTYRFARRR